MTKILGISAYYHDSAVCLVDNGEIIFAAQEERYTRIKHDHSFPLKSIKKCLVETNTKPSEINNIIFYEKPFLKFERILETYFSFAPKGFKSFRLSMPIWLKEKLFQKKLLISELKKIFDTENIEKKLLFSDHHLSHAASAFFPSPFDESAVITIDGVGEWATTTISYGKSNTIETLKEINFPHSLGLLYSAFTHYAGFKVNSGEYKLMGLAPYGQPIYYDTIKKNLIEIKEDGSFYLNMDYFNYCVGLTMTSNKFNKLFNGTPRKQNEIITQKEMDIAASIQKITEEVVINLAKHAKKITKSNNLCLAGGVALNCVANGALVKKNIFSNLWIQPAAGDSGGALGAALACHHIFQGKKRIAIGNNDKMNGSYLGCSYKDDEISRTLFKINAVFKQLNQDEMIQKTSKALNEGKAIGWMQGRMEFGPRALGCRSIIADPRNDQMQKTLNLKVKFRESFRPFAPSILSEDLKDWFDIDLNSPYMLLVSQILKNKRVIFDQDNKLFGIEKLNIPKSIVPAVTHVDFSSRIQTVHKLTNPIYHKLISAFKEMTGCPILVNTSFNVRGEPIVCSPEDAFRCFMGTDLDVLVINNFYLEKKSQTVQKDLNFKDSYELD